MKIRIALIALSFGGVLSLAAPPTVDRRDEVLQTERELAKAYQASNVDGIAFGVMEEYRLTNSRGAVTTRADDLEEARTRDPKYEIFENHDMDVRVHGETAVVIGITHAKGISRGEPFDAEFQFTDTFVYDNGRWRLFAGHATKLIADSRR